MMLRIISYQEILLIRLLFEFTLHKRFLNQIFKLMKRLFTIIFLLGMTYQSFAQIVFNPKVFNGSVLCDTLSTTFNLPTDFQGRYDYTTTVIKSDTGRYLEIQHHLTRSNADSVKQITTDLYKYFADEPFFNINKPHENYSNVNWKVTYSVFIDGQKEYTRIADGYPFEKCFTTKSTCKEITVYRKTLRPNCSSSIYYPKFSSSVSNDSISVFFRDSIVFSQTTCLALGFRIHTDSITVKELEPQLYNIFAKEEQKVYCITAPCFPLIWTHKLEDTDLSNCIISGIEANSTTTTRIYPNPAISTIQIPEFDGTLQLTNQLGQKFSINGNERFDISNLEAGLYMVSYQLKSKLYREKLIVR